MKLVYFAWVRERIGLESEEVTPPATRRHDARTHRLAEDAAAPATSSRLPSPRAVRIAVDKVHAAGDVPIAGAREVAIFPPMTGG